MIARSTIPVVGYDVLPTVDSASRAIGGIAQQYRFGEPDMRNVSYSDGWIVPTVTMSIEHYNTTTHQWDIVGYTNTHLHKVKVDATDKFDISLGHTDRFNEKGKPLGSATPSIID